jgi:hypothetical protein
MDIPSYPKRWNGSVRSTSSRSRNRAPWIIRQCTQPSTLPSPASQCFKRHLAAKLPRRRSGPGYQFDDEVRLEYYRLQKISEGSINLRDGDARPLDGPTEVGSGLVRTQPVPLSQLIDLVNERFGTDFNQADQLFFDQIVEAAMADDGLRQAAAVNPGDRFELVFKHLIENLFVERMDQNEEIFVWSCINSLEFIKSLERLSFVLGIGR